MTAFFQIAYFIVGLAQFFAVWDGVDHLLGVDSFFGSIFTFFVAGFVAYVPILGSVAGVYGAVEVWDWSLTKAILLFFWYVPVFIGAFAYDRITSR